MAKAGLLFMAGGLLASLLVASTAQAGVLADLYTVTDLGTLGGAGSHAWAINNLGQVVGEAQTASGAWHAFLWDPSTHHMQDLGTLGYGASLASDINDSGTIVGRAVGTASHAFVWTKAGGMQAILPQQYSSEAWSISSAGQIAGFGRQTSGADSQGFVYTSPSSVRTLGQYALGINASGWAVGEIPDPSGTELGRGALWQGSTAVDLPASTYQARAINANGWVIGRTLANASSGTPSYAFVWDANNGLRTIGPSPSVFSVAFSINDSGVVVGDANTGSGNYPWRGTVWDSVDGTVYVDSLLSAGAVSAGWRVSDALDINNLGQMVGAGYARGMSGAFNSLHAILLKPLLQTTGTIKVVTFRDDDRAGMARSDPNFALAGWWVDANSDSGPAAPQQTETDGSALFTPLNGEFPWTIAEANVPAGWQFTAAYLYNAANGAFLGKVTDPTQILADISSFNVDVYIGNVPEPATLALLAAGSAFLLVRRARRRSLR